MGAIIAVADDVKMTMDYDRQSAAGSKHRCKKRFLLFFIKNAFFNAFYFLERFLFSSGEMFYPTKPAQILLNLLNSCILKRLLNDGFNMAAIKNTLMKSHNPQTLSCILRQ